MDEAAASAVRRSRRGSLRPCVWLMLLLLAPALACSSPVGVRRTSAADVHRALTANVLTTGQPSAASTQVLHRLNLFGLYQDDPEAAIRALRAQALEEQHPADALFALAELEFSQGERACCSDGRPNFLAAAFYAWRSMQRLSRSEKLIALDPRFRLAADLYNRGLTAGLATADGEYVDLTPRTLPLPFGELELAVDEEDLLWGGYRMTHFVPVAELEVRGLRNRHRRPGIGAPLAASLEAAELEDPPPGYGYISSAVRVAATAVVVFGDDSRTLEGDVVAATLHLFTLDDATSVDVGDHRLALEYEPTAALAFGLAESRPWDFERWGFLRGDFGEGGERGLRMLGPYDPERIPVVFVHGTASSSGRWAEMINDLRAESAILAGYQFWIFQYNTGNPVPFSAGLLHESLAKFVALLDPEGDDENLRRMVVIGHSQGGLLTKLCVVDSGDVFWRLLSAAPIDELDLQPEARRVLERSLFFERLPFVESVVFIATPHRGSFLADRWFSRLASTMVSLPRDLYDASVDLIAQDDDRVLLRGLEEMPSSIDNMTPDNRFIRTLAEMPIAPGVRAHSIIAVQEGQEDIDSGHDGVVSVESARLPGVDSELIVRSGHSTQLHPLTIAEVARILREGLVEAPATVRPSGSAAAR